MISRSALLAAALVSAGVVAAQPPGAPSSVPAAAAPAPVADPRGVAARLAELLERDYVFPDTGQRYAAMLRDHAAQGRYDASGEAAALGRLLTDDLRAVSPDNHLRVMPEGMGPRMRRVPAPSAEAGSGPVRMAPPPGAPPPIEAARWIAPGIAFVRFNIFPMDPDVTAAARQFMEEHVDANTIIFDIRTHGGGGIDQMDAIFPYLFARETRLVAMETRASVARARRDPMGERPTLRTVAAGEGIVRREHFALPHPNERRLADARVFVLTSGLTGSAAEHFALAMKHSRRATLIGEATAGANHFGGIEPIGGGLAAFIPVGRTVDPVTGRDWEGDGVAPDIAVPAERALVEALVRSGVAAEEAERLSAEVAPTRPMRRLTPRR